MRNERLAVCQAALAERAAQGADHQQIVSIAVKTWRDVYCALSPIIGARGVCALYQRSLHMSLARFPWLASVYATALDAGEFNALRKAFSEQTSTNAATAQNSLLEIFWDLLSNLIGESLTERLLTNVWNPPSSATTAPEI
jgi:hypothetical protein